MTYNDIGFQAPADSGVSDAEEDSATVDIDWSETSWADGEDEEDTSTYSGVTEERRFAQQEGDAFEDPTTDSASGQSDSVDTTENLTDEDREQQQAVAESETAGGGTPADQPEGESSSGSGQTPTVAGVELTPTNLVIIIVVLAGVKKSRGS